MCILRITYNRNIMDHLSLVNQALSIVANNIRNPYKLAVCKQLLMLDPVQN